MRTFAAALSVAALLSSCGGGSGGGSSGGTLTSGPGPSPSPTSSACSLASRQAWVFDQMQEWYLFPETLPSSLATAGFTTVQDYIDALAATARSQGRDRYFTYITSIREEDAFFEQGASAGFGIRLSYDTANGRLFVVEAFEGAPALAAGLDRGAEITGIGTSTSNIASVSSLFASGGSIAVSDALGPTTAGTARVLQFIDDGGTSRTTTVTKATFEIDPLSPRYGARIMTDGARRVGYVNLRTFIDTAERPLRNAFADFRAQGVTEVIVDLRYNGGGLVSIAELIGDLLGRNRSSSSVQSYTIFRPSKSNENETRNVRAQSQSIAPTRIAFIGMSGTASASELVINSQIPYLDEDMALIGSNTFGKPVGQIALDRSACDDRLRVVAFATQNADRQGDYYNGLAEFVPNTCTASDDVSRPLGDPQEDSIARALDFLAGRSCTPIITGQSPQARGAGLQDRQTLRATAPTAAQFEMPGLF